MLRHLFKLIWNKKKQNFLLITEILVSFIVMFAVFTLLVYFYKNFKKPIGFDYDNVWAVKFNNPENITSRDSLALFYDNTSRLLGSMPEVRSASFASSNFPFSTSSNNDLVTYGKLNTVSDFFIVEDDYVKALNLQVTSGRWFNKTDNAHKDKPVIINESLRNLFFGNENPLGKKLGEGSGAMEIIGVINDVKFKGDFHAAKTAVFKRMDTSAYNFIGTILVNVKPDADAAFESKLFRSLSNVIGSSIEIVHLANQRRSINSMTLVPMIFLFIVAGFLIINVALGLFGVLWYNISKRKSEIGLRRAVGASSNGISKQLVGEALVLATISILGGSFFALQFPLMNVFDLAANTYFVAHALAIMFIYILVIICALYPAKQGAAIFPAVALHED